MEISLRVLRVENQSEIQKFAKTHSKSADPFAEWSAPWREESLKHYLPQGWCLGAFKLENKLDTAGALCGFVLAQPILFWMKNTQSLWIEGILGETPEVEDQLLQAAIGWAKDKHLQRVVMSKQNSVQAGTGLAIQKAQPIQDELFEVLTTRRSNHG